MKQPWQQGSAAFSLATLLVGEATLGLVPGTAGSARLQFLPLLLLVVPFASSEPETGQDWEPLLPPGEQHKPWLQHPVVQGPELVGGGSTMLRCRSFSAGSQNWQCQWFKKL